MASRLWSYDGVWSMREKQESGSVPVPAEFMSAQSAIVGLRGRTC